jgi:hypothetical protein
MEHEFLHVIIAPLFYPPKCALTPMYTRYLKGAKVPVIPLKNTLSFSRSLSPFLPLSPSFSFSLSLTGEGERERERERESEKEGESRVVWTRISLFLSIYYSLLSLSLTGDSTPARPHSKRSSFSQSVSMRDYYINCYISMTEQDKQQCPLSAEAGAALLWIERSIAPKSGSTGRIGVSGSVQGRQIRCINNFCLFAFGWRARHKGNRGERREER